MRRTVIAALLLGGVCIAVGVLVWWFGGPYGPAGKLVGAWDVMGSGFEDAVKDAIAKKDPEAARGLGDKFRSTQRIYFDRDGSCRHVQDLLGLTITAEGTWQATATNEAALSVKFHKKKVSVRDQKGQTKEEAQDTVVEWIVAVVEPDQLSVTMTADDGQNQRFVLRRAKD